MIFIIQNHALENDAMWGYLEHFEDSNGAPRAKEYCQLSMRLIDIDLLGNVGLKIDLGQCIMILTIKKHDRESAVM